MTPQALDPSGYGSGLLGNLIQAALTVAVGAYAWATRKGRDAARITRLEADQKAMSEELKTMSAEQKETNSLLYEMVGKLSILVTLQEKK